MTIAKRPSHRKSNGATSTGRGFRVAVTLALCARAVWFPLAAGASDTAPFDYHTMSRGSRGDDVRAAQELLRRRGYSQEVNGTFGTGTYNNIRAFQASRGLTSDGIVGPATWSKLIVTPTSRTQNSSGEHVRAIVWLLQKWGSSIAMTSTFTSTVETAVNQFKSHMGLTVDGVVATTAWEYLVFHYTRPPKDTPSICLGTNGGTDTSGWATESWSADHVATTMRWTGEQVRLAHGDDNARVAFRDASYEHGGTFHDGQHGSHRYGYDQDVRPMSTSAFHCTNALTWNSGQYSQARTRTLIVKWREAGTSLGGDVHKVTYFNDPVLYNDGALEVSPLSGHDDHLHVRACTEYFPTSASYGC